MKSINLRELQKYQIKRDNRKYEFFNEVLKKCHHKILWNAQKYETFCFFTIPKFIIGLPKYSNKECIEYLMNKLINDRLKVLFINPNILFITWDRKYSKPKPINENNLLTNKNTITKKPDYKPTKKILPSSNFIYDNELVDILKNKTKIL